MSTPEQPPTDRLESAITGLSKSADLLQQLLNALKDGRTDHTEMLAVLREAVDLMAGKEETEETPEPDYPTIYSQKFLLWIGAQLGIHGSITAIMRTDTDLHFTDATAGAFRVTVCVEAV